MAKTVMDQETAARQLHEARARFQATLAVAKRDLAPQVVSRRVTRRAAIRAGDAVRAKPAISALVLGAFLAFLFRKPLAGLVRRLLRETPNG